MGFRVTIWGTRGSIPTPGPSTARYGGNTPCVAVEKADGDGHQLLVLDAGTGIRPLGRELSESRNGSLKVDLIVSHTHWDHIQGLPFFAPFFDKENQVRIWGSRQGEVDLEAILRQQMSPVVFPVPLDALAAELTVEHVNEGEFEVSGFTIQAMRLRHPGHTLGYRLWTSRGGASMAYVTDNELGPGGDYDVGHDWRAEFVQFLEGADVLVHDAMYTMDELDRHRGWGHSSYLEAVELAAEAGTKRLVLFHHMPEHNDGALDEILDRARTAANKADKSLEVIAATEGMQLTV